MGGAEAGSIEAEAKWGWRSGRNGGERICGAEGP